MSTDRDVERIVRSWMDEGVTALPDRVLDLVLDQLPATPQRRSPWSAWRFPMMNNTAIRFGIAAVVVVAAILAAARFLPSPNVGGPVPTPTPAATPVALGSADLHVRLAGGRYSFQVGPADEADQARRFDVELALQAGWVADQLADNEVTFTSPASGRTYLSFFSVQRVYRDPCHPEDGYAGSYLGTSNSSDLVNELRTLEGFDAGPVSTLSIGGLTASHFVISNTIDTATAGCTDGALLPLFITWLADRTAELALRSDHSSSTNGGTAQEVWVVNRSLWALLIIGEVDQATAEADRAALEKIIGSITFD